jgi:hypothetical protein
MRREKKEREENGQLHDREQDTRVDGKFDEEFSS